MKIHFKVTVKSLEQLRLKLSHFHVGLVTKRSMTLFELKLLEISPTISISANYTAYK